MANNVQFGLTLANRGVVIGVTTVEQMLQMSEIADSVKRLRLGVGWRQHLGQTSA